MVKRAKKMGGCDAEGNKRNAARDGRALAALGTAPTKSAMANLENW